MRRVLAALALAVLIAAAVAGAPARSSDTYRVDAIFDTAKGIIPGETVKIAGARVGTVSAVALTPDYKARIEMDVPRRFSFRQDASCDIQPEGLISENFVQCDPGTPARPALPARGDLPPTVPVQQTAVPVSLTDLFRIFQADVRQRFTVAVAAVGGGLAARGDDLNAVIARADPTLAAVRSLTAKLQRQTTQIDGLVRDSDALVAQLARRRGRVQDFIVQARRVTERTAARRAQLAAALQRLPALLDAARPAVARLDALALRGRPLLGNLRRAALPLQRALSDVPAFAQAATPTLRALGADAATGIQTARRATPLVALLRRFTTTADPVGRLTAQLLVNLRDRGLVEGLDGFVYYAGAAAARYDRTSHILPAHPIFTECGLYAQTPTAGCNAFYGQRSAAQRRRRRAAAPQPAPAATPRPAHAPVPKLPTLPAPKLPELPKLPGLPPLPPVPHVPPLQTLQALTDYLLGH
jgi:virulence factor Mce-like protein